MLDLSLDELKIYLRIDGAEEDNLLGLLVDAAKEHLLSAGVPESDSKLYKLAVLRFVSAQYENRDPTEKSDNMLQTLILQLKDYGDGTTAS